jgi:Aspartyl protease
MRRLRDLFLRTAILAGAFFAVFSTPSLAADCAAPRLENSVPLEPLGDQGLVTVPITLDGVERKFLFDTGSVANFVSSRVVEEMKLPQLPSRPLLDLRGNLSGSAVRVRDVTFGTVNASYGVFQIATDLPFDGILSARMNARDNLNLANDDLDIDFGAMKLNFLSTDHCDGGGVANWPRQRFAVVPVTQVQGHIELPVTLDGHPLRAALDTGATWTVINLTRASDKLGFSPDTPQPAGIPKDDPGRQIYFRKYSALSFEGVTIANPLIIVRPVRFGGKDDPTILASRAQHASDFANRVAPDIIIGMEILRHLHIYYAIKEEKLYITPATSASASKAAAPPSSSQGQP